MEREFILHVEVDIHGARFHSGTQHRSDAPVGQAVEPDDFLSDFVQVGNAAFRQRRHFGFHLAGQEKPRAVHTQAAHLALHHLQSDDSAARILLGNHHGNGLKTFFMIRFFQRRTRLLDIVRCPAGTEKRIYRLLDLYARETLGSFHPIFTDVESRDFLSGKCGKWECQQRQPDTA